MSDNRRTERNTETVLGLPVPESPELISCRLIGVNPNYETGHMDVRIENVIFEDGEERARLQTMRVNEIRDSRSLRRMIRDRLGEDVLTTILEGPNMAPLRRIPYPYDDYDNEDDRARGQTALQRVRHEVSRSIPNPIPGSYPGEFDYRPPMEIYHERRNSGRLHPEGETEEHALRQCRNPPGSSDHIVVVEEHMEDNPPAEFLTEVAPELRSAPLDRPLPDLPRRPQSRNRLRRMASNFAAFARNPRQYQEDRALQKQLEEQETARKNARVYRARQERRERRAARQAAAERQQAQRGRDAQGSAEQGPTAEEVLAEENYTRTERGPEPPRPGPVAQPGPVVLQRPLTRRRLEQELPATPRESQQTTPSESQQPTPSEAQDHPESPRRRRVHFEDDPEPSNTGEGQARLERAIRQRDVPNWAQVISPEPVPSWERNIGPSGQAASSGRASSSRQAGSSAHASSSRQAASSRQAPRWEQATSSGQGTTPRQQTSPQRGRPLFRYQSPYQLRGEDDQIVPSTPPGSIPQDEESRAKARYEAEEWKRRSFFDTLHYHPPVRSRSSLREEAQREAARKEERQTQEAAAVPPEQFGLQRPFYWPHTSVTRLRDLTPGLQTSFPSCYDQKVCYGDEPASPLAQCVAEENADREREQAFLPSSGPSGIASVSSEGTLRGPVSNEGTASVSSDATIRPPVFYTRGTPRQWPERSDSLPHFRRQGHQESVRETSEPHTPRHGISSSAPTRARGATEHRPETEMPSSGPAQISGDLVSRVRGATEYPPPENDTSSNEEESEPQPRPMWPVWRGDVISASEPTAARQMQGSRVRDTAETGMSSSEPARTSGGPVSMVRDTTESQPSQPSITLPEGEETEPSSGPGPSEPRNLVEWIIQQREEREAQFEHDIREMEGQVESDQKQVGDQPSESKPDTGDDGPHDGNQEEESEESSSQSDELYASSIAEDQPAGQPEPQPEPQPGPQPEMQGEDLPGVQGETPTDHHTAQPDDHSEGSSEYSSGHSEHQPENDPASDIYNVFDHQPPDELDDDDVQEMIDRDARISEELRRQQEEREEARRRRDALTLARLVGQQHELPFIYDQQNPSVYPAGERRRWTYISPNYDIIRGGPDSLMTIDGKFILFQ